MKDSCAGKILRFLMNFGYGIPTYFWGENKMRHTLLKLGSSKVPFDSFMLVNNSFKVHGTILD